MADEQGDDEHDPRRRQVLDIGDGQREVGRDKHVGEQQRTAQRGENGDGAPVTHTAKHHQQHIEQGDIRQVEHGAQWCGDQGRCHEQGQRAEVAARHAETVIEAKEGHVMRC